MSKYFRTQLECVDIDAYSYGFFVAGRSCEEVVRVWKTQIPLNVREVLTVGKIVHAHMESGVPRGITPRFDLWETT